MSDNPALLAAIAANPADDLPRLVYADWLDENGQPERAEFIRVQMELERYRGTAAEAPLKKREAELLAASGAEWLNGLDPADDGCRVAFRRGFPDSLTIVGRRLAETAEYLTDCGPTLREVSVVGVRTFGASLSRCRFLESVRVLRLEGWPLQDDMAHLAASPHLPRLRHLSWWLTPQSGEATCRQLGRARWLPQLDRIELVQLFGGVMAEGLAEECDEHAGRCRAIADRARGVTITDVNRVFDTEFVVPAQLGQMVQAGTVRNNQLCLIVTPDPPTTGSRLLLFDANGRANRTEWYDIPWEDRRNGGVVTPQLVRASAAKSLDFRPQPIRLREFSFGWPSAAVRLTRFSDAFTGWLGGSDTFNASDAETRSNCIDSIRSWLTDYRFALRLSRTEFWVKPDGDFDTPY